jgi:hypothetical protein
MTPSHLRIGMGDKVESATAIVTETLTDSPTNLSPTPSAPETPKAPEAPRLSPRSGHDSWPPLVGDSERTDEPVPGGGKEGAPSDDQPALPQDPVSKQNRTRGRYQQRIDTLVEQRADVQALYDGERRKNQDLEARLAALEGTRPQAPTGAAPAKPTVDQFETYEEFAEALAGWITDQRMRQFAQVQSEMFRQNQQTAAEQAFQQRRAEFVKAHPDYDEVVGASDVTLADHVADLIRHEPDGPALAYHFAQHPDEAARISSMPPGPAWYALGRLAERLATPQKTGAVASALRPAVPRAPAPLTPVGSSGHRSSDPSELEFGPEYMRRGNQADRERRKLGLR